MVIVMESRLFDKYEYIWTVDVGHVYNPTYSPSFQALPTTIDSGYVLFDIVFSLIPLDGVIAVRILHAL